MSINTLADAITQSGTATALTAALPVAYLGGRGFGPQALAAAYVGVGGGLVLAENLTNFALDEEGKVVYSSGGLPSMQDSAIRAALTAGVSYFLLSPALPDPMTSAAVVGVSSFVGQRFWTALSLSGVSVTEALKDIFSTSA